MLKHECSRPPFEGTPVRFGYELRTGEPHRDFKPGTTYRFQGEELLALERRIVDVLKQHRRARAMLGLSAVCSTGALWFVAGVVTAVLATVSLLATFVLILADARRVNLRAITPTKEK